MKFWMQIWKAFKEFWVFTIFWPSGFFGIFWKSPGFLADPRDSEFLESRDFYPLDFRPIPGIFAKSPGIGIFSEYPMNFLSPGSGFFRKMGYSDKKPTLIIISDVVKTIFILGDRRLVINFCQNFKVLQKISATCCVARVNELFGAIFHFERGRLAPWNPSRVKFAPTVTIR